MHERCDYIRSASSNKKAAQEMTELFLGNIGSQRTILFYAGTFVIKMFCDMIKPIWVATLQRLKTTHFCVKFVLLKNGSLVFSLEKRHHTLQEL